MPVNMVPFDMEEFSASVMAGEGLVIIMAHPFFRSVAISSGDTLSPRITAQSPSCGAHSDGLVPADILSISDSGTLGSSTERFRVGSGNQEPAASERNEKTQQETCVTTHVSVISFAGSENHSVDEFVAIIAILARAHRHSHQIIGEGGVHSEAVGVPPTQIGVCKESQRIHSC